MAEDDEPEAIRARSPRRVHAMAGLIDGVFQRTMKVTWTLDDVEVRWLVQVLGAAERRCLGWWARGE